MSKISLQDPTSGYLSASQQAENNSELEDHLNNKVLYRDNPSGEANSMQNDLDMNSNDILNAKAVNVQSLSINGVQVSATALPATEIPAQSGNSGKYLTTNGTSTSWDAIDSDAVVYSPSGVGASDGDVQSKLREAVSLKDFGAVGDGATDDTAAIQAAFDNGGTIFVPDGTYEFSSTLTLDVANTVVVGSRNAIFNFTVTTADIGMRIRANGVRLIGFSITSDLANETYVNSHIGIYGNETVYSPSVTITYLEDIVVHDVDVSNFGSQGIRFDYLQRGRITNNRIQYCGSHGIMCGAGTFDTVIDGNTIMDIKPGDGGGTAPYHPAYGITITRDNARNTTEAPISLRNEITNNRVIGVPSWIGIDLHGAQQTKIHDNATYLCGIGIHLEDGNGGGSVVPVTRASIEGNICIGTTGTAFAEAPGINLIGSGGASDFQRSITVKGNTVINHGYDTSGIYSSRHGAIHAYQVENLIIEGNAVDAAHGVAIYLDDIQGGVIKGNSVYNVQTSNSDTYGVYVADGDVTALIEGNVFFGASPQINIASAASTSGPDTTFSIKTINNIHHGTATKFQNIELLHAWHEAHTTTQRNAINRPPAGMVIYNSTTGKLNVYTTAWEAITSS